MEKRPRERVNKIMSSSGLRVMTSEESNSRDPIAVAMELRDGYLWKRLILVNDVVVTIGMSRPWEDGLRAGRSNLDDRLLGLRANPFVGLGPFDSKEVMRFLADLGAVYIPGPGEDVRCGRDGLFPIEVNVYGPSTWLTPQSAEVHPRSKDVIDLLLRYSLLIPTISSSRTFRLRFDRYRTDPAF
jgi:hypothetical protein